MERFILHVDVNSAFLSWTAVDMLKNGASIDIREIPSAIGGDEETRSGVIVAKSIKAKICGVSAGDSIYIAKQKCPQLRIYPGDYDSYQKHSDELYNLFLDYTEKVERYSIDECFLDITEYLQGRTVFEIAEEIHNRVKEELGFTVNIGISNNKILAKMASDFEKPDKIHTLFREEIPEKMWPLPVKELFMLGRKTVPKLYQMRIRKIGDLAKADRNLLIKKFGKHGNLIWEYANGIDESEVKYKYEKPKGIGNSLTFVKNTSNIHELEKILLELTEQVAYRLRKVNMVAKVVNVQLRTKDFVDFSHQGQLDYSTDLTKEIYNKAKELLHQMYKSNFEYRLLGIRVDKLEDETEKQISFFENKSDKKQEKIDKTIDKLKNKYGFNSITRRRCALK